MTRSTWARKSTKSIPTSAPNARATLTSHSTSKCAPSAASPSIHWRETPEQLMAKYERLQAELPAAKTSSFSLPPPLRAASLPTVLHCVLSYPTAHGFHGGRRCKSAHPTWAAPWLVPACALPWHKRRWPSRWAASNWTRPCNWPAAVGFNGAGVRYKVIFKVYTIALYTCRKRKR